MKVLITKLFLSLLVVFLLFHIKVAPVHANIPYVGGRVVSQSGSPIAGVWVKWVDAEGSYWHTQTDECRHNVNEDVRQCT